MAGLLDNAQHQPADAGLLNQPDAQGSQDGGDPNQEKAVLAALDLFYHPDSIKAADQALSGAHPAEAAGMLAASLVTQVDEANGGSMPEDVVMPAATEVLNEVMDYAEKKGIHNFSADDEEAALTITFKQLADAYGVTPEEYAQFAQEHGMGKGKDVMNVANKVAASTGFEGFSGGKNG